MNESVVSGTPVLAVDIVGVTTRLAYFETHGDKMEVLADGRSPSRNSGSLIEIITRFADAHGMLPERTCLGIAPQAQGTRVHVSLLHQGTPHAPARVHSGAGY